MIYYFVGCSGVNPLSFCLVVHQQSRVSSNPDKPFWLFNKSRNNISRIVFLCFEFQGIVFFGSELVNTLFPGSQPHFAFRIFKNRNHPFWRLDIDKRRNIQKPVFFRVVNIQSAVFQTNPQKSFRIKKKSFNIVAADRIRLPRISFEDTEIFTIKPVQSVGGGNPDVIFVLFDIGHFNSRKTFGKTVPHIILCYRIFGSQQAKNK